MPGRKTQNANKRQFKFRQNNPNIFFSVSVGEKDDDTVPRLRKLLHVLERTGYICFVRFRDEDAGELRYQTARCHVPKSGLVLAYVNQDFLDDDWCQYEVALAMDFSRHIILIKDEGVQIPPLFQGIETISNDKHDREWEGKILYMVQRVFDPDKIHPCTHINMVKEFLWNIEAKVLEEQHEWTKELVQSLMLENRSLRRKNRELIELRLHEEEEFQAINTKLEESLAEKQGCSDSYFKQTAKEYMRDKQLIEQLQVQVRSLQKELTKQMDTSSEVSRNCSEMRLDWLYKALTNNDNEAEVVHDVHPRMPVPTEIASFFHRYQGLIGSDDIPQIGLELGLTCHQLDEVERVRRHGPEEMFWQLCRQYSTSGSCHVSTMINAFSRNGINIEGRPMPTSQKTFLEGELQNIYTRMKDVLLILPYLLQNGNLTPAKAAYIEKPKSKRQTLDRLLEVLATKENGFAMFCDALEASGQYSLSSYLKDKLCGVTEEAKRQRAPSEGTDPSTIERVTNTRDQTDTKQVAKEVLKQGDNARDVTHVKQVAMDTYGHCDNAREGVTDVKQVAMDTYGHGDNAREDLIHIKQVATDAYGHGDNGREDVTNVKQVATKVHGNKSLRNSRLKNSASLKPQDTKSRLETSV